MHEEENVCFPLRNKRGSTQTAPNKEKSFSQKTKEEIMIWSAKIIGNTNVQKLFDIGSL